MDIKLQIFIIISCILYLVFIINMIRKEKLDLRYALVWILVDIAIIILCVFPKIIDFIAGLIGIATPVNMVFFFGIVFQIIIVFSLTREQSQNAKKIKELAQRIALLENEKNSGR